MFTLQSALADSIHRVFYRKYALESACLLLYWVNRFCILQRWAGTCEVRFFPGDNPDAAHVDKKAYEDAFSMG